MNKLEKTIIWILEAARERRIKDLSKLQIQKLVYLIDVEFRRFSGESFFGNITFYREKLGPLSVQVYDALKNLDQIEKVKMEVTDGAHYQHPRHGYSLTIGEKNLKEYLLSDGEMAFIGSALNDYIGLSQTELKKIAYATEPMQAVQREEKKGGKSLGGTVLNMDSIPLDEDLIEIVED